MDNRGKFPLGEDTKERGCFVIEEVGGRVWAMSERESAGWEQAVYIEGGSMAFF